MSINNPEFLCVGEDGCFDAHSFKKSGATHPCRCSCSKDDVDARARWKRGKCQQDVYVDVMLPWPDVKVASKLCIGGPCHYNLKEGIGVSD